LIPSTVAAEDYKSVSRTQWSGVAGAWGRHAKRFDAQSGEVATAWMLDAAGLRSGEQVLELACGPAGVGLQAARADAPDGRVLCTDFAEPMVQAARRRAAEENVENVDFRLSTHRSASFERWRAPSPRSWPGSKTRTPRRSVRAPARRRPSLGTMASCASRLDYGWLRRVGLRPRAAVATEPSRAPIRCLARPSSGMSARLVTARPIPIQLAPGCA
jgi:hypothetical protein